MPEAYGTASHQSQEEADPRKPVGTTDKEETGSEASGSEQDDQSAGAGNPLDEVEPEEVPDEVRFPVLDALGFEYDPEEMSDTVREMIEERKHEKELEEKPVEEMTPEERQQLGWMEVKRRTGKVPYKGLLDEEKILEEIEKGVQRIDEERDRELPKIGESGSKYGSNDQRRPEEDSGSETASDTGPKSAPDSGRETVEPFRLEPNDSGADGNRQEGGLKGIGGIIADEDGEVRDEMMDLLYEKIWVEPQREEEEEEAHSPYPVDAQRAKKHRGNVSAEAMMHLRRIAKREFDTHRLDFDRTLSDPGPDPWAIRMFENLAFPGEGLSIGEKEMIYQRVCRQYPVSASTWAEVLLHGIEQDWTPSWVKNFVENYERRMHHRRDKPRGKHNGLNMRSVKLRKEEPFDLTKEDLERINPSQIEDISDTDPLMNDLHGPSHDMRDLEYNEPRYAEGEDLDMRDLEENWERASRFNARGPNWGGDDDEPPAHTPYEETKPPKPGEADGSSSHEGAHDQGAPDQGASGESAPGESAPEGKGDEPSGPGGPDGRRWE